MTPQRGNGRDAVVAQHARRILGDAGGGDLGPQRLQDTGVGCVRHPGMEPLFRGTSAGTNLPT